jgi:hypothetical protein
MLILVILVYFSREGRMCRQMTRNANNKFFLFRFAVFGVSHHLTPQNNRIANKYQSLMWKISVKLPQQFYRRFERAFGGKLDSLPRSMQ